jgi:uncharacterized protein YjbI with pentapeptide repeats
MANPEHLEQLGKGKEAWNKWLEEYAGDRRTVDLSSANLSKQELENYNFVGVNLKSANLRSAILTNANFLLADLSNADLSCAKIRQGEFNQAILENANFSNADLFRSSFIRAKLNRANLRWIDGRQTFFAQADCMGTNFTSAMLEDAKIQESHLQNAIFCSAGLLKTDFSLSNLTKVNFQEANLSMAILNSSNLTDSILINADLSGLGAWGTDFINADFTGSCIEGWRIDGTTKFTDAQCTHIYMQSNQEERLPYDVHKFFQPKEFERFIQKAQNTVDLIFANGIDWQAFLQAFLKLKSETGDELSIYSIEDKWDGYFVVRVNVPPDADKKVLEMALKREYELKEDKQFLQQRIIKLENHLELVLESLAENQRKLPMTGNTFNIEAKTVNIANDSATQINNIFEKNQDMHQIASEIETLLNQFKIQGLSENSAQEKVADELVTKAKSDSTMMEKLKSLGASFAGTAGKAIVTESVKIAFKLALEKAGIKLE